MSMRPAFRLAPATLAFILSASTALAQAPAPSPSATSITQANYRLAARFAPYKIRKLVYSTGVTPRWIKGSERFWYEWDSPEGKKYMVADPGPAAASKHTLFDNDRIAAELTRITRDPWDG